MKTTCSYCNSLQSAIIDDNVCSINGAVAASKSVGNSFYVKANYLNSGEHISRLTFRGVLNGYQRYRTDEKDYLLNDNSYLMLNEGDKYSCHIRSEQPIESVIVAFGDRTEQEVNMNLNSSTDNLLDNPFLIANVSSSKFMIQGSYQQTPAVTGLIQLIKTAIIEAHHEPMYFEQLHYALMAELVKNHLNSLAQFDKSQGLKKSTRVELFRRTRDAKDFIDASFNQKITLNEMAEIASLSTFHFLRSFKAAYQVTPLEYLTVNRLKYAQYLLKNSELNVQDISTSCGFENHSSFSRLFKSRLGKTPKVYREL